MCSPKPQALAGKPSYKYVGAKINNTPYSPKKLIGLLRQDFVIIAET